MIGKTPFVVASLLVGGLSGHSGAAVQLPEASFDNWVASVEQREVANRSVLFEYIASTSAKEVANAELQVSFAPRFDCAPVVSVTLSEEEVPGDSVALLLVIDEQALKFNGIIDHGNGVIAYTVSSNVVGIKRLIAQMDTSSQATVRVFDESSTGLTDRDSPITLEPDLVKATVFSLLGSKMTVSAAQRYCLAHEPVEYIP